MPDLKQLQTARVVRCLYDVLMSTSAGIAVMATIFLCGPRSLILVFIRLEVGVHHFLHIRQTDFLEMHIALFAPATILALLIFLGLHSISSVLAHEMLALAGGILALTLAPLWWSAEMYAAEQRYGWNPFMTLSTYEVIVALGWLSLVFLGKFPRNLWLNLCIFLMHSCFWIWRCGPYWGYIYDWQVAPFVSLCLGLVWMIYSQKFGILIPRPADYTD